MNNEGYSIAINKCFDAFDEFFEMPTKGALTQARDRISYKFFEDQFELMKSDFKKHQKKYKGFYVYSIDGDIYAIQRNKNLEEAGFYGCPVQSDKESHFLRMYSVTAVDVFSGIPTEFSYGTTCKEIDLSLRFIQKLDKQSISIYDRLYFSTKLVKEHKVATNYFLCRVQRGSFKEVTKLYKSKNKTSTMIIDGVKIRLIKFYNKKSEEMTVFATNLPKKKISNKEIPILYIKRWESEIANRDSTSTLKLEQFHSKNINGILQEIYIHYWFVCFCKMQISKEDKTKPGDLLNNEYAKSNFKETMIFIIENIPSLLIDISKLIYKKLEFIIKKSFEKRKHNSRSNPRICKSQRRQYKGSYSSMGFKWEYEIKCPPRSKNKEFKMNHC